MVTGAQEDAAYSSKTTFAHELFELMVGNAGLIDDFTFKATGHFHAAVIDATMKCAVMLKETRPFLQWIKEMQFSLETEIFFAATENRSQTLKSVHLQRIHSSLRDIYWDFRDFMTQDTLVYWRTLNTSALLAAAASSPVDSRTPSHIVFPVLESAKSWSGIKKAFMLRNGPEFIELPPLYNPTSQLPKFI
jgi:hypothetical protein